MCKLLVLQGHPDKLVACSEKCYDGTFNEVLQTVGVLYVLAVAIASLGLYLLA